MTKDHWSVAFTIVVNGIQVDFMELPEQSRLEILKALIAGKTEGVLYSTEIARQKTAS